jgi:peptidoglycan/LPS O-acetylase OafA/YrhL
MQHLSNIVHTIELSYDIYPRTLIALFNFVDTFFIISGMLTAYFIFKRFNKTTFANPMIWLYISLMRLLRLSPVYILVFWFIKTTSVYMTDGPLWDYGTDDKSTKGLCINDHWWKSLLYVGNWGTMQPICILPAWSIIVDAQYSLVMPAMIYLIFKHKRLGYLLLLIPIVVSTTKMTIQLANQTAVKTSDMAKIRLHVYPLISRFAAEFYNTAWNRIGPVAIGIFGGHLLYLYEFGIIRRWPKFMYGLGFKLVLMLHVLIFLLPVIGRFTDDPKSTKETDTTIFILSNATIKPIWSVINTILLLRLITDLRSHSVLARLMSHNIWHCLGKLCFTSYLIHYEIILTLLKSRESLVDPNWSNVFREFSAVFLISTAISYIIYILYEAPINKLIVLVYSKQADQLTRGQPKKDRSSTGQQPVNELGQARVENRSLKTAQAGYDCLIEKGKKVGPTRNQLNQAANGSVSKTTLTQMSGLEEVRTNQSDELPAKDYIDTSTKL